MNRIPSRFALAVRAVWFASILVFVVALFGVFTHAAEPLNVVAILLLPWLAMVRIDYWRLRNRTLLNVFVADNNRDVVMKTLEAYARKCQEAWTTERKTRAQVEALPESYKHAPHTADSLGIALRRERWNAERWERQFTNLLRLAVDEGFVEDEDQQYYYFLPDSSSAENSPPVA